MGDYKPLPYNPNYEQKQESAGCGRHALNHLLGGTYFIRSNLSGYTEPLLIKAGKEISTTKPMDLQRVCKYLYHHPIHPLGSNTEKIEEICPKSENYHADVLTTALRAIGYNTTINYDPIVSLENKEIPDPIGYLINYGAGHWVSLHKDINGYTYKNSTTGDKPPSVEDTKKAKANIEAAQRGLTDEEALARAIAESMKPINSDAPISIRTYNNTQDYLTDYGSIIYAVITVGARSSATVEKLKLDAKPLIDAAGTVRVDSVLAAKAVTPAPKVSDGAARVLAAKSVTPAPKVSDGAARVLAAKPVTPAPKVSDGTTTGLYNFFTGEQVKIEQTKTEIAFLDKLGLTNNTGPLYNPDGIFRLPKSTDLTAWLNGSAAKPTLTPDMESALKKYLNLNRTTILPNLIKKLERQQASLNTTELGRQLTKELVEVKTYLTLFKTYEL